MKTEEVIESEKKHVMQTYGRNPVVVDHGKGCYLYSKDGKKYLDLIGSLATAPLGYGNSGLAKAVYAQSKKLVNVTNLFFTEEQVVLAEKIAKVSGLGKCFFSNSGSEANEVAIKLARKFTGKTEIISTEDAFHGRTFGALSATWKKKYKKYCEPLVPDFKHIPYNNVKALENAISSKTAAFIVEPIQGEAGIIVPDSDYLNKVSEICKKNNVLLIVDEIQTNLRTGKFFAFQHNGIKPDIVTVAKGIANGVPIGITIASDKVADAFEKGDQGSTFGGNSLSCAAANFVIDFVLDGKLIENAQKVGNYFIKKLNELKVKGVVKDVRGKGLMIAVEMDKDVKSVADACLEKGLLVNVCTEKTLRFLPPLIITEKEVDVAVNILEEAL
jgi:acetylornithine/N-succinyldiaminopimelate aminotransferase|tara:strand:- start:52 stop:1209 length:1158 start_codon:yes stop_codon:yes gene_type:complete